MRAAIWIVAAAATAACGLGSEHYVGLDGDDGPDAGDPGSEPRSGTRLKLVNVAYTDGPRVPTGIHDAQLGADCTGMLWADGHRYCTPSALPVVYADAQCTVPLAYFSPELCDPALPPPDYVTDVDLTAPSRVRHLYRRGASTTVSQYFDPSSGGCTSSVLPAGQVIFALGDELPPAQLAEVTIDVSAAGAFSARMTRSADGLAFPLVGTLHDNTNDFDCYLTYQPGASTSTRCRPYDGAIADVYADDQCLVREVTGTDHPPGHAIVFPTGECPTDPTYATVGAAVSPQPLYHRDGPQCTATAASAGATYYAVGDPISIGAFSREPDISTDDRIERLNVVSDHQQFHDYDLYDQMLDTECQTRTLPDGSMRCVPVGLFVSTFYSDASCQEPISLVQQSRGGTLCAVPPITPYAHVSTGVCSTPEIRRITSVYQGPVFTNFGTCTQVAASPDITYYRIGAVVSAVNWASATIQIDP